jgi:hypothetical protein
MIKKIFFSALLSLGLGTAAGAQGIAGDWTTTVHGQNGNDFSLTFHLKTAGDSLSGNVDSPMGGDPIQLQNGRISQDSLFFDLDFNGNMIHHLGKYMGDSIAIQSERPDGSSPVLMLKRPGSK